MASQEISQHGVPALERETTTPSLSSSSAVVEKDGDDSKALDEKSGHLEGQPVPEEQMVDDAPLAGIVRLAFARSCARRLRHAEFDASLRRPRLRRSTRSSAPAGASSVSGFCTSRSVSPATRSLSIRRQPRSISSTQPRLLTSMRSSAAFRWLKASLVCRPFLAF